MGLFPGMPYLALGFMLGWTSLLFSGRFWASDVTSAGEAIFKLFYVMAASGSGVLMLFGSLSRFKALVRKRLSIFCFAAGIVAAIGSVLVLVAGPYFQNYFGYSECVVAGAFLGGAALIGVGSSLLFLSCGSLYGKLPPQSSLCYTALSYLLSVAVYFVGVAGPTAAPFSGGPTWYSIVLLIGLPFKSRLAVGC